MGGGANTPLVADPLEPDPMEADLLEVDPPKDTLPEVDPESPIMFYCCLSSQP